MRQKAENQVYDNTLKALFGDEAVEIVPRFLPGTELVGEENIEIDRSKLKADLVYCTYYKGKATILNMELQTSAETDFHLRLLQYHVGLYVKHKRPVISMVIYPFEMKIQQPPYVETCGDEDFLRFQYKVLCLWMLEAEAFVRDRVICLYTLLPAMKGATAPLLKQVLKEMAQHYPRSQLGHHLLRFHQIMLRATTMSDQDKQEVEEELYMQYQYDYFIDENPLVQERIEKRSAEATVKGEARGRIIELQEMILDTIRTEFPNLVELAQERVVLLENVGELRRFVQQIMRASDETKVRWLLHTIEV